jgi:hypothetical protein
MLSTILLVFAFVLVLLGAFIGPVPEPWTWRWRLAWAGVACWILSELLLKTVPLLR